MLGSEFVLVSLDSEECQDLGSTHPRTMLQGHTQVERPALAVCPLPVPRLQAALSEELGGEGAQ